jgi:hypothetical protein
MTIHPTPEPPERGVDVEAQPRSLSEIRSLRPRPRRSVVIWVAVAAAGLLVAGGLLSNTTTVQHPAVARPPVTAQALRAQAFDACRSRRWDACLQLLDSARPLDPSGDADPAVQAARATATNGLTSQAK